MAGQFTQFGWKTGSLDLADWDKAIVLGFGGRYDQAKKEWYLPIQPMFVEDPINGPVEIKRAKVIYKRPEPSQIEMDLPEIAVVRDDIIPDPKRLLSIAIQYRLPAEGATPVSIGGNIGFNYYEEKEQERPYDLIYTIECWSRYRLVAQQLTQIVLAAYPIYGKVVVTDSIKNKRTYLVAQQNTADLTEVRSLVDRVCGYSVTIRAEGELTLDREAVVVPGFTGTTSPNPIPGGGGTGGGNGPGPVDPNLPPGGLYGDGLTSTRVTIMRRSD